MLLKLGRPVVPGPRVRPLRLPFRCTQPGDQCQIAGWATTSSRRGKSRGPGVGPGSRGRSMRDRDSSTEKRLGAWGLGGAWSGCRDSWGLGGWGTGAQGYSMLSPTSEVQQGPELLQGHYPEP